MAQKLEAEGGKGGKQWDDFADHENVSKIQVRGGMEGIQFVKFDYVKNGQVQNGSIHGVSGKGFTQLFDIDHLNNEYLQCVEGYYDEVSGVIQGLRFITNMKNSDLMGYDTGTKFSLEVRRKKIIGFHGFAEPNLNSLGAYFTKVPPIKLQHQGGPGNPSWDDGGDYDGVIKVQVSYNPDTFINQIAFDYDKGGKVETRDHYLLTRRGKVEKTFVVNYPNDYITSVEATVGTYPPPNNYTGITSLTFKTSKGITSPTYGRPNGRKFVLESKGKAIVGFYGKVGVILDTLGAYCGWPPNLAPPAEKLKAQGGEGGAPWDDGVSDGVRKIYVGQGQNGVAAVKIVYDKDAQVVEGVERGKSTRLGYEPPFELDYPNEYITAVEGCYDKILGSEGGVITMLKFRTNKRTSQPFGLETTSTFVIEKAGYKIVGFHGNASHELHQLGVHVMPITQ